MGTLIDHIAVVDGRWRDRHSALRLAVHAAGECLRSAKCTADDIDLLVNAGIYRDRNLGEPALAALIQHDIGANPEDPHLGGHGTFSFDVANGTCGVLTALQIVDGFLRSGAVERAMVVASDADPGHRLSRDFPFSPTGAALLCSWTETESGLGPVEWVNCPDDAAMNATVGMVHGRNMLQVEVSPDCDERMAEAASRAAVSCLGQSGLSLDEMGAIVAAPAGGRYQEALAAKLGVAAERITTAGDERTHTAALASALDEVRDKATDGRPILFIAAGAGITAGAALYRTPLGVTKS